MTKEVLVSVKGLQVSPDTGEDTVEVIAPGEYYFKNGKHYVLYNEVEEGTNEVTKNIIKFSKDYMEVTKKGTSSVHMIFETNKKNVTYYYTPYGSLHIGLDAKEINVSEEENEISAKSVYGLEINYEHVADCNISIMIKPRKNGEFKLV